jgi:hypothetical protein
MELADWLVDGAFDRQTFEVDVLSAFKTDTTGHSVGSVRIHYSPFMLLARLVTRPYYEASNDLSWYTPESRTD